MPVSFSDWLLVFVVMLLPSAVISYFCGCFNGAVIVSKYILRDDIRNHGSGNAGLTNFYRTFGGMLTAVVILCDVLKMVIALWLASHLIAGEAGKYWAGLFCLLGHMFPCMFHFKGGKGILSGGTLAIMIDWRVAVVVWGGFLILTALTRYVSLGSLWAGASYPFISWICFPWSPFIVLIAFVTGGLVIWKHRENIERLRAGTENKFTLHRKSGATEYDEDEDDFVGEENEDDFGDEDENDFDALDRTDDFPPEESESVPEEPESIPDMPKEPESIPDTPQESESQIPEKPVERSRYI